MDRAKRKDDPYCRAVAEAVGGRAEDVSDAMRWKMKWLAFGVTYGLTLPAPRSAALTTEMAARLAAEWERRYPGAKALKGKTDEHEKD